MSNALYEDEEEDADYKYSDYFAEGDKNRDDYNDDDEEEEDEEDEEEEDEQADDDVTENDSDAEEQEEEEDEKEDEEQQQGGKKESEKLSSFQSKNQKLSSQISDLEKQLVTEKSWDMKGEVKASDRPENSLLEMYADIERYCCVC